MSRTLISMSEKMDKLNKMTLTLLRYVHFIARVALQQ